MLANRSGQVEALLVEFRGELIHGFAFGDAADDPAVPRLMQIGVVDDHIVRNIRRAGVLRYHCLRLRSAAEETDGNAISALVAIGGAVQRLVDVSREVDYESKRGGFRGGIGPGRLAARRSGAVLIEIVALCAAGNIEEMPALGLRVILAVVVGPGCGVGQQVRTHGLAKALERGVDRIVFQDFIDHRESIRIEMLFRDERDGLMAFAAPSARLRCRSNGANDGN